VAAAIVREMRTATANEAARRLLPANDRENPTPYLTETILAQGEWFTSMPQTAQRLRDWLWTQIKSA
jgi:hypothetical protein